MESQEFPKSLMQAIRYFANPDVCVEFVASMRWPKGAICPHCEGSKVSFLKSRRIWKCMAKECHKQFSAKTGTIFEDSPISLDKWLTAIWLVVNCKNGISSYELAKDLKLTQKSAWFVLHRVRLALAGKGWEKMGGSNGGPVESDETFIGADPRKMHADKRQERYEGIKARPKVPVFGVLDRELRQVRAKVVPNVKRETLQNAVLNEVERGSKVYTDAAVGFDHLAKEFIHEVVNHAQEYVRGEVHTQGLDNFWSLLKRSLRGTYVAVEPFHLDAYVTEQMFRYNNRATKENPLTDADRFALAVSQITGKRLTYAELTGKVDATSEPF